MKVDVIAARLESVGLLDVAAQIARANFVTLQAMLGRGRSLSAARARHDLWSQVRAKTGMSYPEMGAFFNYDHTSIMAGVRKTQRRVEIAASRGRLRVI